MIIKDTTKEESVLIAFSNIKMFFFIFIGKLKEANPIIEIWKKYVIQKLYTYKKLLQSKKMHS